MQADPLNKLTTYRPLFDLPCVNEGNIEILVDRSRDWMRCIPFCTTSSEVFRTFRKMLQSHIQAAPIDESLRDQWLSKIDRLPFQVLMSLYLSYIQPSKPAIWSRLIEDADFIEELDLFITNIQEHLSQAIFHLVSKAYVPITSLHEAPPTLIFRITLRRRLQEEAARLLENKRHGHRDWSIHPTTPLEVGQTTIVWRSLLQKTTHTPTSMDGSKVQEEFQKMIRDLTRECISPLHSAYALKIAQEPVGFMVINCVPVTRRDITALDLVKLVVHPDKQSLGVGKALISCAARISCALKCRGQLTLISSEQAASYYPKLGFTLTDEDSGRFILSPMASRILVKNYGHLAQSETMAGAFTRAKKTLAIVNEIRELSKFASMEEPFDPAKVLALPPTVRVTYLQNSLEVYKATLSAAALDDRHVE